MQEFARVVDGVVVEIIQVPDGAYLGDCIAHDLVEQCQPVTPGEARPNQALVDGRFVDPETLLTPEEIQARAEAAATAQALAQAPNPIYALKAAQAGMTIVARTLKKLAEGEAPTPEDVSTIDALADSLEGAASAMPDTEALDYIRAQLDKSDAADAVIKGASK